MLIIFEIFLLCVSAAILVGLPVLKLIYSVSFEKHDRLIKAVIIVFFAVFLAAGCVKIFTAGSEISDNIFRLIFLISLMPYLYFLLICIFNAFMGENGFLENLAEAIDVCFIINMELVPLIPACFAGHIILLIGNIISLLLNINTLVLYSVCVLAGLLTFVIILMRIKPALILCVIIKSLTKMRDKTKNRRR